MIELNLLPEELKFKKKKKIDFLSFPIVPTFLGIIAFLVAVHVFLIIAVTINKATLSRIDKKWQGFSPQKKEIDVLKGKAVEINKKVKAIEVLTEKRILWAQKMNGLSDVIPSSVWLYYLSYDKRSTRPALVLEGYTTGTEEDVGKFMDALKNNKDFTNLENIELGFTKGSLIEKNEVINFRLICSFKEEEEPQGAGIKSK